MRLFLSAFVAFLIVFPCAMIKHAIDSKPQKREAVIEELKRIAIQRGHVVTAERVKLQAFSAVNPDTIDSFETMGIYEYFYNGERYNYFYQVDNPPMELTLYFVDNPGKATVGGALSKDQKVSWPVIYLIVIAVVYLLMSL